ncbi:MAG: hypothetical protein OER88_00270, partial [Planctomycetota bacterium]|nr:hypothetical protein [Planctomycetota bacterium]
PLRRVFGKRLDNVVAVEWFDQSIEAVLGELEDGYGVPIVIRGDLETKMTVSLEGEMSLLAILLYIENAYDARLVVEKGKLWLEPLMADEGVKPIEQKPAKNKKDG